ncbi:MAG: NTP transferase domain-containing protein [Firmicutes bacterium]|jgi:GTP:adenosylcobinamide-phosphate guanylyltransferase|nr:NTP transferase domain-containing protein [Bacillota bacterium]
MNEVDAVVLAGAKNTGRLRKMDDSFYEASIEIAGRPMLYYVLDALANVPEINRIVVTAPLGAFDGDWQGKATFLPAADSMLENIRRGIAALNTKGKILIVTSDIPLISPAAISDFIQRCKEREADIYYPIICRDVNDRQFPGVKRTYVRLREGVFTGGNMALVSPDIIEKCSEIIERAIAMRKNPLQLSRLLGFKFIIKFLLNQLSLREIEARVQDVLHCRGVGVISPYPQVGIDVDKPSDLELVRQVLEGDGQAYPDPELLTGKDMHFH